jgi:hypothetical protein
MKNVQHSVARILMFVLISFAACKKDTTSNSRPILPKQEGRTATSTRIIIMIHGGAWTEGDKGDFNDAVAVLQSQLDNFALFNINYRLLTQTNDTTWVNRWPAQIGDVNEYNSLFVHCLTMLSFISSFPASQAFFPMASYSSSSSFHAFDQTVS